MHTSSRNGSSASPIVYAHFGNTFYLKKVLEQAVRSCPDRPVILLGDETNAWLSNVGIKHYDVKQWSDSNLLHRFDRVFRLVGGDIWLQKVNLAKTHISGTRVCWTWFNFAKWIYLYCYMFEARVGSVWFFDSDMLLLGELAPLESDARRKAVRWTYWNSLHQQQGWIGNKDLIHLFIEHFLSIFDDSARLMELENTVFRMNPQWGFTLMRAWDDFFATKSSAETSSSHINSLGVMCSLVHVISSRDESGLFRNSARNWNGENIVELYVGDKGRIYAYHNELTAYIPILMLDTSLANPHLFDLIVALVRRKHTCRARCICPIDGFWAISMSTLAGKVKLKLFPHHKGPLL